MYAERVWRKDKSSPGTDGTSILDCEPVRRLQALSGEMQVSQMWRSIAPSGALPRALSEIKWRFSKIARWRIPKHILSTILHLC